LSKNKEQKEWEYPTNYTINEYNEANLHQKIRKQKYKQRKQTKTGLLVLPYSLTNVELLLKRLLHRDFHFSQLYIKIHLMYASCVRISTCPVVYSLNQTLTTLDIDSLLCWKWVRVQL